MAKCPEMWPSTPNSCYVVFSGCNWACLAEYWNKFNCKYFRVFHRTFNFPALGSSPVATCFHLTLKWIIFTVWGILLFISDKQRLGLNTLSQTTVMCLTFCSYWRMRYWLKGKWDISSAPFDRHTNERIKQHDST